MSTHPFIAEHFRDDLAVPLLESGQLDPTDLTAEDYQLLFQGAVETIMDLLGASSSGDNLLDRVQRAHLFLTSVGHPLPVDTPRE